MKLAHLADLHLGFRQYERQTPRGGNQREADIAEAFRRAVDDLVAQRPDLIVLAGDIFHSVRPTNSAILEAFQEFQRLRHGAARRADRDDRGQPRHAALGRDGHDPAAV